MQLFNEFALKYFYLFILKLSKKNQSDIFDEDIVKPKKAILNYG